MTPRAAQRERELAASPTQLSPASPVTEEESSSVLQRVNRAVSAANWEEEARVTGETAKAGKHQRQDAMAIERLAVFNTPLPPGAQPPREQKEVTFVVPSCPSAQEMRAPEIP